jgi:hypothetical protein
MKKLFACIALVSLSSAVQSMEIDLIGLGNIDKTPKFSTEDVNATIETLKTVAHSSIYHAKNSLFLAVAFIGTSFFMNDDSQEVPFAARIAESARGFSESLAS